jgi:hypothetical protein
MLPWQKKAGLIDSLRHRKKLILARMKREHMQYFSLNSEEPDCLIICIVVSFKDERNLEF